ncbi:serine O-acetyltransferase [soil metagenome]
MRGLPEKSGDADFLWETIRRDAEAGSREEPALATLMYGVILVQDSIEAAIGVRISQRLDHAALAGSVIATAFAGAIRADPLIAAALRADLAAYIERDPATGSALDTVLHLKGFHALAAHRLAHWLWRENRKSLSRYVQSRSSEVFQTDIHPAVPMGSGIFLDHATGIVIGETAVLGDDISILQGVTLGGTGKDSGDRHPKVRRGVMIGAGAKVLGNIEIGEFARVGAGSVVLKDVPPRTTAVGVPARIVGAAGSAEPSKTMDQIVICEDDG